MDNIFSCECGAAASVPNAISPMCPGCGAPMKPALPKRGPWVAFGGRRPLRPMRGSVWFDTSPSGCVHAWMKTGQQQGVDGWGSFATIPFHSSVAQLANEMEEERK